MRKKLDTRFPAARIKKIMQADEDVGKIAMAVPLLVSKALEQFLQDLCDRTYEITLRKGAKTMNSLHLKMCVQSHSVFDFLKEIVSKVPDFGSTDSEDRSTKRRKATDGDNIDGDDEARKNRNEIGQSSTGKVPGRGRGRPRGSRGGRTAGREAITDKLEDGVTPQAMDMHQLLERVDDGRVPEEPPTTHGSSSGTVRNFDLNMELDGDGDTTIAPEAAGLPSANTGPKNEELPLWPPSDMCYNHFQLSLLHNKLDEDEDYDNEDDG